MFGKAFRGWILVGIVLAPSPVYGQSVRERLSEATAPTSRDPTASGPAPNLARVEALITRGTNAFRGDKELGPLTVDPQLSQAARSFADYMARTDKYGHTADGREPWERAASQGYEYCILLENIAYRHSSAGFTTGELARGFVTGWKESPGHRKNMLDPDTSDIGVAVAHNGTTGRYYAVQLFGRPKGKEIVFKISNRTDSAVEYAVDGETFSLQPRYTRTHHRCRPPELTVPRPAEAKSTAPQGGKVFRPSNESHYVIRKNQTGGYAIEEP